MIREAESTLEARLAQEEAARAGIDAKREAYDRVGAAATELETAVRGRARRDRRASARRRGRRSSPCAKRSCASRTCRTACGRSGTSTSRAGRRRRWKPSRSAEPGPRGSRRARRLPTAPARRSRRPTPPATRARTRCWRGSRAKQRRAELEDVRKRIQALGEVNLGAIEEHEELSERCRFLSEQKHDLDMTLASLQEAIQRINRTSRKRFRETFEAVSKHFSENFPRLFRGGKASLSLTESEDVLEAGIEIMAMPPGKRLQNVNLLSGGEKTLTAIALLIAIFQVKPSPFFLLDEVDAALDDANVGRFNEIVRELAVDSQFVLITHNKRTIEVADVLYGVTMERKGVSKLVSVELH